MSKLFMAALSFLACSSLFGQAPEKSPVKQNPDSAYVLAEQDIKPVTVFLKKQADCLAMPLTVTSEQKELPDKYTEIRQVQDIISKKAQENPFITVQKGLLTLSTKAGLRILSISSYAGGDNNTQSQLCLLIPLASKNGDVFECTNELKRFLDGIPLPSKAKLAIGEPRLAVENPERFRPELLKLIAGEIKLLKDNLGDSSEITLDNIQAPVSARQADDKNVEIYINYKMSMTIAE